jgi:hypothetical protein
MASMASGCRVCSKSQCSTVNCTTLCPFSTEYHITHSSPVHILVATPRTTGEWDVHVSPWRPPFYETTAASWKWRPNSLRRGQCPNITMYVTMAVSATSFPQTQQLCLQGRGSCNLAGQCRGTARVLYHEGRSLLQALNANVLLWTWVWTTVNL